MCARTNWPLSNDDNDNDDYYGQLCVCALRYIDLYSMPMFLLLVMMMMVGQHHQPRQGPLSTTRKTNWQTYRHTHNNNDCRDVDGTNGTVSKRKHRFKHTHTWRDARFAC